MSWRVFKISLPTERPCNTRRALKGLACLLFLGATSAFGRQTAPAPQLLPAPSLPSSTPAAVRAPTAPRTPRPTQVSAPQGSGARGAPRSPLTPNAPPTPKAANAPLAPTAPKQLVTVVHRLSGWKLLAWLALTGPPMLELERFPSATDVHTNIVAGFVAADGKTIVARLQRAEALLETSASLPPPDYFAGDGQQPAPPSEFVLILGDGRRIDAKFVGLDGSTGLSLREASEPVLNVSLNGDEGNTEDPTVGQLVRSTRPPRLPPLPRPRATWASSISALTRPRAV